MNLLDTIIKAAPEAHIVTETDGIQIVAVTPEELPAAAQALAQRPEGAMDFLYDLTGMDWGEEGFRHPFYR